MNAEELNRFYEQFEQLELDIETKIDGPLSGPVEQESILTKFYISGEAHTTGNYPLDEYVGPVKIGKVETGGRGLFVTEPVDCGQIVLISNSEAACISYDALERASTSTDPPAAEHPRTTTQSDPQDCRNEPDEAEKFEVQARRVDQERDDPSLKGKECGSLAEPDRNSNGGPNPWTDWGEPLPPEMGDDIDEHPVADISTLPPSATLSKSSPQDSLPASGSDRIPHDVCLHLAVDLLMRITSLWKARQIFSLDHRNSLMSDDHIDMPIYNVHIYGNEPSARTATTEREKLEKPKEKVVQANERQDWMDKLKHPIRRTSNEEADKISMILNIVGRNASFDEVRSRSGDPQIIQTCKLWGVWLLPSFINHSCVPNCNRLRVGDALIIRSSRNLLAGEELTLPYFDIFEPLQLREKSAKLWGFRCECLRCAFERSLGKPFEDLQRMIINLKQGLDTFWIDKTISLTEGEGMLVNLKNKISDINMFLIQLFPEAGHVSRPWITQTMPKDNEEDHRNKQAPKSRLQKLGHGSSKKQKAKARRHARMETVVQPNLETQDNDDTELDLDEGWKQTAKYWIMGSFIDAYIAEYALLCKIGNEGSSTGGFSQFESLQGIFRIIDNVHPGNMLGHEYCELMLDSVNQTEPNGRLSHRTSLRTSVEHMILEFVAAFYGRQDRAVLLALLK